jgi:hypothetical protein
VAEILIYDPTVLPTTATIAGVAFPRSLAGLVIGVIDNTKPNFDNLARELTAVLRDRHQVADVVYRKKRSPTVPAEPIVYDELAARCHLILCGSGD